MARKGFEKRIEHKIYLFETKRTLREFVLRIGSILLIALGGIFFGIGLIKQLAEQRTFDLLALFQEDKEIVKEFWRDVLDTFYVELPKIPFIVFIFCSIVFLLFVLFFVKNFVKIRNKMRSIISYWFHH